MLTLLLFLSDLFDLIEVHIICCRLLLDLFVGVLVNLVLVHVRLQFLWELRMAASREPVFLDPRHIVVVVVLFVGQRWQLWLDDRTCDSAEHDLGASVAWSSGMNWLVRWRESDLNINDI